MQNTVKQINFFQIKKEKKETILKKNTVFSVFFYLFCFFLSFWFVFHYSLRINASNSLNGLFYLVSPVTHQVIGDSLEKKGEIQIKTKSDTAIKRGMIVEVQPPKTAKTSQKISLLKIIRGIPGDVVTERNHSFYINGEYIGDAKSKTASGKRLAIGRTGVIPKGHYFIWTPDKDSYDSRYADINWIPERFVLGIATSLSPLYWGKRGIVFLNHSLKEMVDRIISITPRCVRWV